VHHSPSGYGPHVLVAAILLLTLLIVLAAHGSL
jgi:hypothetical protein